MSRVLNDYDFGGYLIWAGVPVAIDGRTELYGERFMVELDRTMTLKSPDALFVMLKSYRIDATLLWRRTPAAQLLDHVDGWKKVFADDQCRGACPRSVGTPLCRARNKAGFKLKPGLLSD